MQQFLYQYDLNPTTWVYLSSLLIVAIYFKFSRFWSIRNFDLLLLLAIAPGLLLLAYRADASGVDVARTHSWGYVILFSVGFLFLARLLADTLMVRRPLLEPNLSPGGLTFLGIALFVFLMTNVLTARLPVTAPAQQVTADVDSESPSGAEQDTGENAGQDSTQDATQDTTESDEPPSVLEVHRAAVEAHPILRRLPSIPSKAFMEFPAESQHATFNLTARILVVVAHFVVLLGLLAVGMRHFGNLGTGVAMAALYLLLPYTAQLVGRVDHVLPAAFLVLAIVFYRRPAVAGFALVSSLAVMLSPIPLFLLPLWISFYWQRGLGRFAMGIASGCLVLLGTLLLVSAPGGFWSGVAAILGSGTFHFGAAGGFWESTASFWRLPVAALFLVISLAMAIWPAQKNLGTLICCSATLMVTAQFWYPFNGMMYVHWYLPLVLMTVFRPNLENRVAIASLGPLKWSRKRQASAQAA